MRRLRGHGTSRDRCEFFDELCDELSSTTTVLGAVSNAELETSLLASARLRISLRTSLWLALTLITASACSESESGRDAEFDRQSAAAEDVRLELVPASTLNALAADLDLPALRRLRTLSPLPSRPTDPTNAYDENERVVRFGRWLFFDPRLSSNGEISCASCHDPEHGFSVDTRFSEGLETSERHAPVLLNQAHARWFYWDGRRDTLWSQALSPIEDPKEMGFSRQLLQELLQSDNDLRSAYRECFGVDPDEDATDAFFVRVGKALAAYQARLESRDAPFDRFVEGVFGGDAKKIAALDASAQRGLAIFLGRGECTNCHNGPNFSDGEFHNIGLDLGPEGKLDRGRYEGVVEVKAERFHGMSEFSDDSEHAVNDRLRYVTQKDNNLGEFKTPTLREVTKTAPYMRDGRFSTLTEVFEHYSKLERRPALGHREESLKPFELNAKDARDLEAFLHSLEGRPLSKRLLGPPEKP